MKLDNDALKVINWVIRCSEIMLTIQQVQGLDLI